MRKQISLPPTAITFLPKFDELKQYAKKTIISPFTQNQPQNTVRKFAIVDFIKQKRCNS